MSFNLEYITKFVFLIVWFFVAYFIVKNLMSTILRAMQENLPLKFSEVKDDFGEVLHKFRAPIRLDWVALRGLTASVYVYKKNIVVEFFGKCIVISNRDQFIVRDFYLGQNEMRIRIGDANIGLYFRAKQLKIINEWISNNK